MASQLPNARPHRGILRQYRSCIAAPKATGSSYAQTPDRWEERQMQSIRSEWTTHCVGGRSWVRMHAASGIRKTASKLCAAQIAFRVLSIVSEAPFVLRQLCKTKKNKYNLKSEPGSSRKILQISLPRHCQVALYPNYLNYHSIAKLHERLYVEECNHQIKAH